MEWGWAGYQRAEGEVMICFTCGANEPHVRIQFDMYWGIGEWNTQESCLPSREVAEQWYDDNFTEAPDIRNFRIDGVPYP